MSQRFFLFYKIIVFAIFLSQENLNAAATQQSCLASKIPNQNQVEVKKPITYSYWPPGVSKINPMIRQYWQHRFQAKFTTLHENNEIATAHLSPKDLIFDAILSLTQPGDHVRMIGVDDVLKPSPRMFQRNINSFEQPSLIIISEDAFITDANANRSIPMIILRKSDSKLPTLLSPSNPLILETVQLDKEAEVLTTSLTVTVGHPELIARINRSASYRNEWIPKQYQKDLGKFLERQGRVQRTLGTTVSIDLSTPIPFGQLPKKADKEVPMDVVDNLGSFVGRDPGATLDLGIGQPHIQLAPEVRNLNKTDLTGVSRISLLENLRAEIKKWYQTHYNADIERSDIIYTSGTTSAIEQVLSQIPEGSTILIPEYSYSGIHRATELHGLNIKTYSPIDDSHLNLTLDPSVKLIVTNFPHNPTGRIMTETIRSQLHRYAEKGVMIFNDLSYTRFAYDNHSLSSLFTNAKSSKNLVEAFSTSKDLGMTENRLAALIGDPEFIRQIENSPFGDGDSISKKRFYFATQILQNPALTLTTNSEMQARRDQLIQALTEIGWPASKISKPQAGLNVMAELPPGVDASAVTRWLWREAKVFAAPDTWFGKNPGNTRFLRFSLSEDSSRIASLGARLKAAGISYSNMKNSIFLSAARISSEARVIHWKSAKLGQPAKFQSPEKARQLVAEVYDDPHIKSELDQVVDKLGGLTSAELWDKYFLAYDKLVLYDPTYITLVKKADTVLNPDGLTVDLGSGTGNLSVSASFSAPKRQVIGVDLSSEGIMISREKVQILMGTAKEQNISFVRSDGSRLPIPTASAKNILVVNTFYAVKDQAKLLKQIHDILTDDGTVFLHDFFLPKKNTPIPEETVRQKIADTIENAVRNGSPINQYDAAFLTYMNRHKIYHSIDRLMTFDEFKVLANQNGLEVTSSEPSGYMGGTSVILRRSRGASEK